MPDYAIEPTADGREFLFTSESVTEGHPDKMADRISDSVLDAVLADDERAIQQHVVGRGGSLVQTFKEVESGRDNARPQLGRALEMARLTGATLVIAKLDRLSRNAAFLLALQGSGVRPASSAGLRTRTQGR